MDMTVRTGVYAYSHGQMYFLQTGLKVFGERGKAAIQKEIGQMDARECFRPMSVADMMSAQRRKAMEALAFLTKKKNKTIKGRIMYNGKPTQEWLGREDSASPTASLESIVLLAVIDAKERRYVKCYDIPNAFIQAMMPYDEGHEHVFMKITGVLVDLLVEMDPQKYASHVVYENGCKVLYVLILRAIYGMLIEALVWYRKFRKDLESIGFKFSPYDPCVAWRMWKEKQQTIRFHVDDLMASHVNDKANEELYTWL